MRNTAIIGAGLLLAAALCACTAAQVQTAVADGQLFCGIETASGPLVVALADSAGAPVNVIGTSAQVVAAACAVIGAIPVMPPAVPAAAPVVAVPVAVVAK